MSTIRTDTLQNAAGTKSVPVATVVDGSAKAWVNFNGTGTVAIRAAFNVSSITDNGVGDYTCNFTAALADANYSVVCGQFDSNNGRGFGVFDARSTAPGTYQLAASARLRNAAVSTDTLDVINASVAIFR